MDNILGGWHWFDEFGNFLEGQMKEAVFAQAYQKLSLEEAKMEDDDDFDDEDEDDPFYDEDDDEDDAEPDNIDDDPEIVESLQEGLAKLNKYSPAFDIPYFLALPLHDCKKARKTKKSPTTMRPVTTKEMYVVGWKYHKDPLGVDPVEFVPEKTVEKLAIIYREGFCVACNQYGRSSAGRVVETALRPPLKV